jgi:phospholipid/cholesterol/gamma-HCH transport system ATP-binding protein
MSVPFVLEIDSARASRADAALSLRLAAGEFALIDTPDPDRAAGFADVCAGLVPLVEGTVRVLGHDWKTLPHEHAAALRGRIGRAFGGDGGWIGFLDVATAVLLPQLHHTRWPAPALRDDAAALARRFGLPGLPLDRPNRVTRADLTRAACVRALLGEPLLLMLESPALGRFAEILPPLLDALATARDRGAAVVWLAPGEQVWGDTSVPATHRYRLREQGLLTTRLRS